MISVFDGDITKLKVDCVVNAANKSLRGGGGVDGAIHKAAGPELLKECIKLGGCETGDAKMTNGYDMPCKYICHTVGPVYSGNESDSEYLSLCYMHSLNLAKLYGCSSIAFPAISCGVYGYPVDEACVVALNAIETWLRVNGDVMDVILCCFDKEISNMYRKLLGENNG